MKSYVDYSKKLILEIWRSSLILGIIMGAVGLGLFVLSLILVIGNFDIIWMIVCVLSAIDIALTVFYVLRIVLIANKVAQTSTAAEISFEEDHVILHVIRNGEVTTESKYYYRDITYVRPTAHYLIGVIGKTQFFPMESREDIANLLASKGVKQR